jgi:Protein of unknown function (DUF2938)
VGEVSGLVMRVALIGIGATLLLDFWSVSLKVVFGASFPNYTMVGRWIGHFAHGRFVHESVAEAPYVAGEHIIGWIAHYGIGILYAGLLVAFAGVDWLNAPTALPALIVGVVTVAAPFFIMQPAMGSGIASSRTPKPNLARVRSLAAHAVFGLGLYLSAVVAAFLC